MPPHCYRAFSAVAPLPLAAAFVAVLALLLSSTRAEAQPASAGAAAPAVHGATPPTQPTFGAIVQAGGELPANGSVLIDLSAGVVRTWALHDRLQQVVAFDSRRFEQYAILTPSAPQQPSTVLKVTVSAGSGGLSDWVGFGQPRSPQRPALTGTFSVKLREQDLEVECCSSLPGDNIGRPCLVSRRRGTVEGAYALASTEAASALTQVLVRVRAPGSTELEAGRYQPITQGAYRNPVWVTQAEQYCIDVDAVEIGTGEVYTYPELSPLCVPHGAMGEVGEHTVEIDEQRELAHERCQLPPSGYVERWCQINALACQASPAPRGCEAYGHVCLGEPLPRPRGRVKQPAHVMPQRLDQSLCSTTRVRGSTFGSSVALALLCLARRRRSRQAGVMS